MFGWSATHPFLPREERGRWIARAFARGTEGARTAGRGVESGTRLMSTPVLHREHPYPDLPPQARGKERAP